MTQETEKQCAAIKALEFVKEGMRLGLGTGSTAAFFIKELVKRGQEGLFVEVVATSKVSEEMARKGGLSVMDINQVERLDLTVDGADEVDSKKRLIKGAGGALTREKIIANMSQEMLVICDESKLVPKLGKAPIPVEIIPFGLAATKREIEARGCEGTWRRNQDNSLYMTDNQNAILDLHIADVLDQPEEFEKELISIPGVVETGFFFNLASRILVGKSDGSVEVRS